jgi:hypothetical protein
MAMTNLAYLLAASHSGSTLLTMLLNAHPDVATIGELSPGHIEAGPGYRCSCGQRIRECRFWRWVASTARAKGLDFRLEEFGTAFRMPESRLATRLLRPLHRGPGLEILREVGLRLFSRWPSRFPEIVHANEILVDVIMEYFRARLFVDKGNTALRLKYLLQVPSFDVKVIRLIRDGRAVALTYMDPARFADAEDAARRGGGMGGDRARERLPIAQAAHEWRRSNEEAECALRRLHGSQWIEVRYEELCADVDGTLNRILTFLGLDPAKRTEDFRSVEHHVVGNGMRLDTTSEIRLDERWRGQLTEQDLKGFDEVAGEMNRHYGYV